MPRERENKDVPITSRGPFNGPGDLASHRGLFSSIFGGRDPFDDPFFSRPFGRMFEPRHGSFDDMPHPNTSGSKGLLIEELDSDDEQEDKNDDSGKGPLIEHPDDEEEVKKDVKFNENHNRIERTKPQTHSTSFKKVTYGGINGTYYTAATTRKSGSDGMVIEDSKEADKATGRATHRISKGIHEKGHSVMRKLGTDGKVDTVQTLHNLNEDELAGFEQEWKGNADMHIPGWNEEFNLLERTGSGSMRPFNLALKGSESVNADNGARRSSSSGGRPKKVVTINIDWN
ncbi:putative myeloid leukemia factor [Helianthus annuus]|uniref:Myeloid leukemia factor n=1 Tax=Helianthus annuus TaxID=4232 RepID=A0A9K3IQQ6_HELAN|nr:putative myeloid leukemia factor [Helianthus annuus]KAJ0559527.1 putative myeloid leukemia factor [Helianthus annuus]KAJ0572498.1 putative myeloid leukemia factor [Helianthus annuus]KAJ0736937.1 putative myeloid leukemia factor [Helianthus annuus]KAJ0739866.1 putative myeloid leukemia factor [Helianthus annuus]